MNYEKREFGELVSRLSVYFNVVPRSTENTTVSNMKCHLMASEVRQLSLPTSAIIRSIGRNW